MPSTILTDSIHTTSHESLAKQVKDISQQISEKWNEFNDIGLMEGRAGMTLLFAYLSKLFTDKGYEAATLYSLNDLKDSLLNDELGYNLPGGVAGVGFVFQHLKNMGVLDSWTDLDLSELDEFIGLGADNDFKNGNWDPLMGLTGLGIYFLERNEETKEKKYLEKIVDYLQQLARQTANRSLWITPGNKKYNDDNYNFGMAHGMPGVLSFLAQVHSRGIKQGQIRQLIESSVPFLLENEYLNDPLYSFPSAIDVLRKKEIDQKKSRLAWCYGDLSMANALLHCSKALHRDDWNDKAISIALKSATRSFENSGCIDAHFCHGTAGLAHQFNRLAGLTRNTVFESARDYWLDITVKKFYRAGEGAGGYYSYQYVGENDDFEPSARYGLLEGSAGIALVYLSILYHIPPEWDIIFLTNV
jgi:lantibiotic biosynthesis protein